MFFTVIKTVWERSLIAKLYNDHSKELFYVTYGILGDKGGAEDAMHNAFEKVMENPGKIENVHKNAARKYLEVICRREAYKMYNKRKKALSFIDNDKDLSEKESFHYEPETSFMSKCSVEDISYAIQELDSIYQDVIMTYVVNGHDYKKVAEILNLKEGTVRKRIYRAKVLIKEIIKEGRDNSGK